MDYSKLPDARYTLTVAFSCSVANADKLAKYSLEEIEQLKTAGPSVANLDKFKANDKLNYESALKTNDFWSNYLYSNLYNGDDMYLIFERASLRDQLTPALVKAVAKRYISDQNVIKIVQLPEVKK